MTIDTIMFLIAGLGAFLIGFKLLSENLSRLAGKTMRKMFNKISGNKIAGVAVGAGSTALIQSSAATTVMLIGFVNAGLLTLYQAVPIIMGANVGTTITALILSLDAVDVPLYAMGLSLVGIFSAMLVKKERTKTFCLAIAGIGLVFFGLKTMSTQMHDLADNAPFVREALSSISFPLLLMGLGIVFTIIMQSSTAVTGILLSMAGAGIVIGTEGGNGIYFVILGTNIGTCLTAIISAIGASTNAKRTAVIHLLFNVVGSVIFLIILWIWSGFGSLWDSLIDSPKMEIALFHMAFNLLCTIMFLPFSNVFVKLAEAIIPAKKKDKKLTAGLLDERLLRTPAVAVGAALIETQNMATISMKALTDSFEGFMDKDESIADLVQESINKVSAMNAEITSYLVKVATKNIGGSTEAIVSSIHTALPDILRIGELSDNLVKYTRTYNKEELVFSEPVLQEIKDMFEAMKQLFDMAMKALEMRPDFDLAEAERLEDKVDGFKKSLLEGHMQRLNDGVCRPESSGVFINLVNNLERAGDHMIFIAENFSKLKQ